MDQLDMAAAVVADMDEAGKSPLLQALGERVRNLRARRGLTRRSLAAAAQVSERHLANLEYGTGNVSILVLHQISLALQCSMAELLGMSAPPVRNGCCSGRCWKGAARMICIACAWPRPSCWARPLAPIRIVAHALR